MRNPTQRDLRVALWLAVRKQAAVAGALTCVRQGARGEVVLLAEVNLQRASQRLEEAEMAFYDHMIQQQAN